jgi:hypothetical protein
LDDDLDCFTCLADDGIVAAQGGPHNDPPGKPLTSVTHDGSLTGDGTTASPLGMATTGVTAVTASAPLVTSGSGSAPNISLPGVIIGTTDIDTTGRHDRANTAVGTGALSLLNDPTQAMFAGSANTASGFGALQYNFNGGSNTATGALALRDNIDGGNNTASGAEALVNNTTGGLNTASGWAALHSNTTGFGNTASGASALRSNTTGNENTAVGDLADVCSTCPNLTNATAIGASAVVDASNKIRLGENNVTVIEGQVAYTFTSDATKKENFRPVDGEEVLRKIGEFNPTSWNYIGNDPKEFRHYGPMAQEFFAAFGHDEIGTIGTPTTINSGDMAGILMIAVQTLEKRTVEQREEVAEQKQEVEALKAENATLKAHLDALEKLTKETLSQK